MQYKNIQNYPGYQITSDGRVWSEKSQKFLKPKLRKDGYLNYTLSHQGKTKTFFAHRLVAIAFIPNPNNLPCINHKDQNPLNNNVDNLEWCDYSYNNNFGSHNQKMAQTKRKTGSTGKAVIMCDKKTGQEIKEFISASEAARYCGHEGVVNGILRCAKNEKNYKTSFGYKWKFKEQ